LLLKDILRRQFCHPVDVVQHAGQLPLDRGEPWIAVRVALNLTQKQMEVFAESTEAVNEALRAH
jgi:hypothetical protein